MNSERKFGRRLHNTLFGLSSDFTFINHGAFGCAFALTTSAQCEWIRYLEAQPLRCIDRTLLPLITHCTRRVAELIRCDARDVVITANATTALTAVVRSFALPPPPYTADAHIGIGNVDAVIRLDIAYGAVKKMCDWLCATTRAALIVVDVDFADVTADAIVRAVERKLEALPPMSAANAVRLAVIDHISSNTALLLPIERIIALCREHGVLTIIDGAHSLFTVDVDVGALGCDVFVGNMHKWFCSAKGAGFLFASRSVSRRMSFVPPTISHGFRSGILSDFIWTGCHDYSAVVTVIRTLAVWEVVGVSSARQYCRRMIDWATEYLCAQWRTEALSRDDALSAAFMRCIRLNGDEFALDDDEHNRIQNALYESFHIECPIKLIGGRLFARISAHIYNEQQDYEKLADAIKQIRPKSKSHVQST